MNTRYGVAPWTDTVSKKRREFPAFKGDIKAPLLIIGGGMTGCMTAYACAAAGQKVILVEADRIGMGGTSRASGFFSSEATESFRELDVRAGRRASRAMFDLQRKAPRELASAVKRLNLKSAFQIQDAIRIVRPGASDKLARKEVSDRAGAGLDASWLAANAVAKLTGVPSAGGSRLRDCGFADPYALAMGFLAAAIKRGAKIHERSKVKKITFDRKVATVTLDGGSVISPCVVVCTGEPNELFKALKRHFRYEERYVVRTAPLPAAVRHEIGPRSAMVWDHDVPAAHQSCFTADHRAVFAGDDQKRPPLRLRDKTLIQRSNELMYELTRFYPAISGVHPSHGWDVPLAHSIDGALYAGAHRNFPHQLFAFGTSHDPARAYLASRILLRAVIGQSEKDDEHFSFSRNL